MKVTLPFVCLALLPQFSQQPVQSTHSKTPAAVWTMTLSGKIDGSGCFQFSKKSAKYHHKHWGQPQNVTLNGKPWKKLKKSPKVWKAARKRLDLNGAWVVKRSGRDVIALEKTADGFDLHLSDSPNGAGHYSVTIAIPLRERLE